VDIKSAACSPEFILDRDHRFFVTKADNGDVPRWKTDNDWVVDLPRPANKGAEAAFNLEMSEYFETACERVTEKV
jgi:hypothetical protein